MTFFRAASQLFFQRAVRDWFSLRAKCGFGGTFQFLGARLKMATEAAGLGIRLSLIRFSRSSACAVAVALFWGVRAFRGAVLGWARAWPPHVYSQWR